MRDKSDVRSLFQPGGLAARHLSQRTHRRCHSHSTAKAANLGEVRGRHDVVCFSKQLVQARTQALTLHKDGNTCGSSRLWLMQQQQQQGGSLFLLSPSHGCLNKQQVRMSSSAEPQRKRKDGLQREAKTAALQQLASFLKQKRKKAS